MSDSAKKPAFFTFKGRARRREYWGKVLYLYLVMIITVVLAVMIGSAMSGKSDVSGLLFTAVALVCLVCSIAMWPVTVRRLHDRNMSGWWLLWFFLLSLIPLVGWLVPIAQFVIVGLLSGTPGPNHFGPDPKAHLIEKTETT